MINKNPKIREKENNNFIIKQKSSCELVQFSLEQEIKTIL
jgi:hypothetical protein